MSLGSSGFKYLVAARSYAKEKKAPVMGKFLCIVLRGNRPWKLQHVPLHNDEICFKIYGQRISGSKL